MGVGRYLIRLLRRWHERFGHTSRNVLRVRGGSEWISIGMVCACGDIRPIDGVRIRRKQSAIIEVEDTRAI